MSARIVLDGLSHKTTPFQAGTQITGKVHVTISSASLSAQNAFPEVLLSWTGSSKLKFEHELWILSNTTVTRAFLSTAILFHHQHILTERSFAPAASHRGEDGGTLVFPFKVTLPAFAEPISTEERSRRSSTPSVTSLETDIWLQDEPWPGSMTFDSRVGATSTPQRLPDSSPRSFFYTSRSPGLRFEGSFDYVLQAELPDAKSSANPLLSSVLATCEKLTVVNRIPDLTWSEANRWNTRDFEAQVRCPPLEVGNSSRRLSLKDRAASLFKKNDDPVVGLGIQLESKQALFLNARDDEYLPFRISVDWQQSIPVSSDNISERSEPPKVYLTRLRVSLQGHVAARTNSNQMVEFMPRSADGRDEREIFAWKEASKSSERKEIAPGAWWEVGPQLGATHGLLKEVMKNQSRDGQRGRAIGIVPDVCVPNLVRNYSLCWEVVLNCAGQEVKWKYGGDGELGVPITLEGSSGLLAVDQELPAYES